MRHRRRGRRLGRSSSHRKAMLRNLASSLFLTERDEDEDDSPKVKGRVVTTLHKAKEVRPLVERCITIACRSLEHLDEAEQYSTTAKRGSVEWKEWRQSETWQKWCAARAPVVAARRRAQQLLGDKQAVRVLFSEIAPRFTERPGGYTRVLRLATRRLGDAGERAILELVGVRDRVTVRSEKPKFADDLEDDGAVADGSAAAVEESTSEPAPEQSTPEQSTPEDASESAEAKDSGS